MFDASAVTVRILANPISNALQKRLMRAGADARGVIATTHALLSLLLLPAVPFLASDLPSGRFLMIVGACAALAVAGNAMLVEALSTMDLSLVGPINAYKPIVSLIIAWVLIGETAGLGDLLGIGLITIGSWLIVVRPPGATRRQTWRALLRDRGVRLRLGALVLSALEAVVLKRALAEGSPMAVFVGWSLLGWPIAVATARVGRRQRPTKEIEPGTWKLSALLALSTGAMQSTTLLTFDRFAVGPALALFQLSSIVSVLLGRGLFSEGHFRRRLLCSLVMALGAILIVT